MRNFRVIVLTSGMSRGSNLLAMDKYFKKHNLPVKILSVFYNRKEAPVANRAAEQGIEPIYFSTKDFALYEKNLLNVCRQNEIDLIALAGFMLKLSRDFIEKFSKPILNIHPAILPEFGGKGMYGIKVHEAVLAAAKTVSGATVHLVNPQYDEGKIVLQRTVNIADCISPECIAERVLEIEHEIYGEAVWETLVKEN